MNEPDLGDLSPEEAEAFARFQEKMQQMSVGDHLAAMMHTLAALAVQRLALDPDLAGERDLEQAKQAIDAFKALSGVIEYARPKEAVEADRRVLSQLQMGFVAARRLPEPGEAAEEAVAPQEDGSGADPEPEPEEVASPESSESPESPEPESAPGAAD